MPQPGENTIKDLTTFSKALTDMYKVDSIDKIIDAEWILDDGGFPIKNQHDSEKNLQNLYDLVCSQKSMPKVYFTSVPVEGSNKEKTVVFEKSGETYKPEDYDINLINSKHKAAALEQMYVISNQLQSYKGDSPNMLKLKSSCQNVITELSNAADKDEFSNKLNEFAKSAESFYQTYAPGNLNSRQSKNASICYSILKLRDSIEKGEAPKQPDKVEEIQSRIAAKYVKAYCMHTIRSDKSQDNIDRAWQILNAPKAFRETLDNTLKDPSFLYLYGSRVPGDEQDVLKRIGKGLTAKPTTILKNVEKERTSPSREKQEIEALRKQAPPKRVDEHQKYESMSLEDQKPIAEVVKSLREELDAIGGNNNSSPEFEKLKHELLVADIRLQRENEYMDVKLQMAELGDAVDAYLSKKAAEGKLNNRSVKRVNVASRIRNLCDGVSKNKKLEEFVKDRNETAKEILAERVSTYLANEMTKTGDPALMKEGLSIVKNKKSLEVAKKQILNSDSFKELFSSPKKVEEALAKRPSEVYEQICDKEFKTLGPIEQEKLKIEKVKEEKQLKEQEIQKANQNEEKVLS